MRVGQKNIESMVVGRPGSRLVFVWSETGVCLSQELVANSAVGCSKGSFF